MARSSAGLAGLLTIAVAGCGGPAEPSALPSDSAGVTASPTISTPAPTATATVAPQVSRWRVISTRETLGPAHLMEMTIFREALVAVGAIDDARGVIWSSSDGEVWTSIAGSAPLDGVRLRTVAAGTPGIVVAGSIESDAIAMFSPNGTTWSSAELPGSHRGSSIVSIAWGPDGFVAVGGGGEPEAVVAWRSTDGLAWAPVSLFEEGHAASLNSVVRGPNGFLADGLYDGHPATWGSSEGVSWDRHDLPGTDDDDPGRLRFAGGRYFLPASDGRIWSSLAGREWVSMSVPGFGIGMLDIVGIPGGFVAVGRSSEGSQPGVVATAGSDPTSWTLEPADPALGGVVISALRLLPDGVRLIGVGTSLSGESVFVLPDAGALLGP